MDYKAFREDALEKYASLPDETNDLYKRYFTEMRLPEIPAEAGSLKGAPLSDSGSEATEIPALKKAGINFDLVVSGSNAISTSGSIKVCEMESISDRLPGKLYRSSDNRFAAYSNANSRTAILVDHNGEAPERLNMLFIGDSDLSFQSFFNIGEKSRLSVFQMFVSTGKPTTSMPLQEFVLGKGSELELTLLSNAGSAASLLHLSKGTVAENGTLKANFVYAGAGRTKAINIFGANGTGSSIEVNEAVYGSSSQIFDINTCLTNHTERSRTRLSTGAVLTDTARCNLKGYAKIDRYAKAAFSNVSEKGILLSADARIDALPDMSIDYSDQVSATHSASTSPMDKEALFYINSRGIGEAQAREIFVSSFISKYLSGISHPNAMEISSSVMLSRIRGGACGMLPEITAKDVWYENKEKK